MLDNTTLELVGHENICKSQEVLKGVRNQSDKGKNGVFIPLEKCEHNLRYVGSARSCQKIERYLRCCFDD